MIETQRLIIQPLSASQLQKYMLNDNSLEQELGVLPSSRIISPELQEALEQTIFPNVVGASKDSSNDSSNNYLFSTLWTIIAKDANAIVGDLCFVGEPNQEGEIEIGYGTYEQFQNKGFMTEAVAGMIAWAKTQPRVRAIVASTAQDNSASFAVLLKNGFEKIGESDTQFHWKHRL